MQFNRDFIKSVIPNTKFHGVELPNNISFAVDSRIIKEGDIFLALQGQELDGHDFVLEAIENGAAGIFINKNREEELLSKMKNFIKTISVVVLENVFNDFLKLAAEWRNKFKGIVVGITGSVGKTSIKEIVGNILNETKKNFLISHGNQNTLLGIALNILRIKKDHEIVVLEMGISKPGQMAKLADLVKPKIALISNIAHSHMVGLGYLSQIAAEKRDIFKNFAADYIGIINGDQPLLADISYPHPVLKFGKKLINPIQIRKLNIEDDRSTFVLKIYKNRHYITINSCHMGLIMNSVAAAAVTKILGLDEKFIKKGIETFSPVKRRFEMRKLKNNCGILIDDCYNANPESLKSALLAFEKIKSKNIKIAVVGDMLGLGQESSFWHRQIGRFLKKTPSIKKLILVGENVKDMEKTIPPFFKYELVPNWQMAEKKLSNLLEKKSCILVKGSRGVCLDKLADKISE